jgi:hypothetical protein
MNTTGGCMAELGRYPIMKSIIVAAVKYYLRIDKLGRNDLVTKATTSQRRLNHNSCNTLTYNKVIENL